MTVAIVLAHVFEAQNESRWLGECYTGGEELVSMAVCYRGAYIQGALRVFENKPPPRAPVWAMSTADMGLRDYLHSYYRLVLDHVMVHKTKKTLPLSPYPFPCRGWDLGTRLDTLEL